MPIDKHNIEGGGKYYIMASLNLIWVPIAAQNIHENNFSMY